MDHLCGWKSVEVRAARGRIGADILGVEIVVQFQLWQLLGQAYGIERIARRPKHCTDLRWPLLKAFQVIGTVVEDDARVGVVDTVVHVVTELFVSKSLADDL